MKIKNGDGSYAISIGNVITILVIIASMAVVYGSMNNTIKHVEADIQLKADRELVETHLQYISNQIEDLKRMVEKLHGE